MIVCERCSTTLWHADDYKATEGFGTKDVGCDYCNPDLVADSDRWRVQLTALERKQTELEVKQNDLEVRVDQLPMPPTT